MDNTSAAYKTGQVVRVHRNGKTRPVEVVWALDDVETIYYRVPYLSTYTVGGQYERSYRGHGTAWFSEVTQ